MANAAIKLDNISNNNRHVGINIDEDTEPTHTLEVNGTLDVSGLATFTRQTAPQILIQPNSDVGCQVRLDKKISESVTVQMALAISAQPNNYTHELFDWLGNDKLILLTAHRRENLGEPMRQMFRAIKRIVD